MLAYDWCNLPDCEGIMLTEIIDPIACLLLLYMSISHASSVMRKAAYDGKLESKHLQLYVAAASPALGGSGWGSQFDRGATQASPVGPYLL